MNKKALGLPVLLVTLTCFAFGIMSCAKTSGADVLCVDGLAKVSIPSSTDGVAIASMFTSAKDCSEIVFEAGSYNLSAPIVIEGSGIVISGASAVTTILDFSSVTTADTNGITSSNTRALTIQNLTILNAPSSGISVTGSTQVILNSVVVDWSNTNGGTETGAAANGSFGFHIERSEQVLIEKCEAYGASERGFSIVEGEDVIVTLSKAEYNVIGIDVINSQRVDLLENTVENNTVGIVILNEPKYTKIGESTLISGNMIKSNNTTSFCSSNTNFSCEFPAGVGVILLATSKVSLKANTIILNGTASVAILSGLTVDRNVDNWTPLGATGYRAFDITLEGNTFDGIMSGDIIGAPTGAPPTQRIGVALRSVLLSRFFILSNTSELLAETIVIDGIDNPFLATDDITKKNTQNICIKGDANLNLTGILDINSLTVGILLNEMPGDANAITMAQTSIQENTARLTSGDDYESYLCDGFSPREPLVKPSNPVAN